MALENLLALDGSSRLRSRRRRLSKYVSGIHISNQTQFEETEATQPEVSEPAEQPSDDYEIALVAHMNRVGALPSIDPGQPMERVLLLSLTWRELLERVSQRSGQANSTQRNMVTQFGNVSVNFATMEVWRADKPVILTSRAFKLLRFLLESPHQVFSRDQLLSQVWGYNSYPSTRTVDNHIFLLRQKLEMNPSRPAHFRTVHGSGYKFVP
jgi:DNA-binding winged helix-turn-helix (wHTH) protein